MSSLNINNLYETMWDRNLKRYEKFDGILQKDYCYFRENVVSQQSSEL